MAERLHPGVFVEERARGLAPIQGVSTSNYGTVGFTVKGPSNVATLVTSFTQFENIFGGFTEDSQVPTHLFAFYANGGRRAYVVRVVASDAVEADGFVANPVSEEEIATGDGSTLDYTAGGSGPLTLAHTPIEPGTVNITYKEPDTAVAGAVQTTDAATDGAKQDFAFKIASGGTPIVPGTVTITATVAAAPVTFTDPGKDGVLVDSGSDTRGFIDYEHGHVAMSFATAPDTGTDITADYTPVGTEQTITDDGAGVLNGSTLAAPGTIDYATGDVEFDLTGATPPADQIPIQAAYDQNAWDIDPISKGDWGNGVEVQVQGNPAFFDTSNASYSKYDVFVALDGVVEETFNEIDFDTPSDVNYFPKALNDDDIGSDLVSIVEPSNEDIAPESLSGKQRTQGAGSGNGTQTDFGSTGASDPDGFPEIPDAFRSENLPTPIQPGSVEFTYTGVSGETRTVTDDGSGNLTGDVDSGAPSGFNQVDYATGKFAFRASEAVQVAETSKATPPTGVVSGSIVSNSLWLEPSSDLTTNGLTGGDDGTAGITRNELTDPALKADRQGMYALLTTNELMNIGVPDAAGDVTMSTDQVTEAETNGKWFVILAPPPGQTPQEVKGYRRTQLGVSSSYAALYYPYIRISDPVTDRGLNIPPIGHIAGVYARTDSTKSVGKAPAGTVDGRLSFSIGLERTLEFDEIDTFFPAQVNALVDTPQTGRAVWGARTLENPPGDFRYVHVRRLFNFLKQSIFNSTHGFVFENVGASLRSRITLSVESFLLGLFQQGLFAGQTPQQAFAVICDETNNPPNVEQSGTVICDIYVAPNTPGEFIVFRIQQKFTSE